MPEERRLVTVLFADVVGSTALGESLDPEDLRRLLSRFYAIAQDVVDGHSGTLEKFIGDAAMAIFGLPQAHDDDARRALDAALELRDRVRQDPALGERLPIRLGVNTGEVVASRERAEGDFLITGDAVNVAARLQQAAEPWQVLASARTASAAGGAYEFGPVQETALKGKATALAARSVLGRSVAPHARAPLVGRNADLAQLELVARRAFTERRPFLVSLIAPAGTGKSRLVEEFLARLGGIAPDARVAVAQCLPYGQRLTYWPMRTLLLSLLELPAEQATPEEIRSRARAWLADAGAESPAETAELLAATIGASDTDVLDRAVLFAAWRTTLELAAARRPLVLVVEDLHWSSDSLLDLVEFILQPRADAPMLMLALTRPELLERRPAWGGGRRNHVSLALEPLDDASVEQLVQNILESPAPELIPIVVERSEGNPFYAGEIVRSLVERGADLRDPEAVAAAAAGLPDTVQATVLSRIDALERASRRVLQLGAVFGRGFTVEGIAALEPALGDESGAAVDRLIERDLLRPSVRGELTFRHILIREVAYGTLPRAERARHHAAAGRWLEAHSTGREDELAELIAFHYREATALAASSGERNPEDEAHAAEWLRRAAEVAFGVRGTMEAAAHLRAAIDLAPASLRPDLYHRLGEVHEAGDPSVEAFASAVRLGREQHRSADLLLGSLAQQLMVMCRWFASVARQPSEAAMMALLEEGRELAAQATEVRPRAQYLIARGFMPFWLRNAGIRIPTPGDLEDAKASVAEGLAIAERIDDPELVSAALDAMTSHRQTMDPASAREISLRRVAMADRLPISERLDAIQMVSWTSAMLGDLPAVVESADEALGLIQPGQNPLFALVLESWRAYAFVLIGRWELLVASLERWRQLWLEADRPSVSGGLQGLLSGIDWARGRGEEELVQRWREVAQEIVGRFEPSHPTAALTAVIELRMDGIVELLAHPERYPDRLHYAEHAAAICADRAHPVPEESIDALVRRGETAGMRVVEAQARRLRGLLRNDAEELGRSLALFEAIGAERYTARVRAELGLVAGDGALLDTGIRGLDAMGELDQLERIEARRLGRR
ncbi:MAG: adenylate/guanylate cyclase domain-containing protein [Candidatus Limnocylindria bacterium]